MSLSGTKALEAWCKKVTAGYANVTIVNMTTSWRSGLAFCAIIHHHCPDLIDYNSLDPDDVLGNNSLAFNVAEQKLGIPSLLDPQDMLECELLDKLSILTYLAQYFQVFSQNNIKVKVNPIKAEKLSNSNKSSNSQFCNSNVGRERDNCMLCGNSVFLLERFNVSGKILHRTCFKCSRCQAQLTLASFCFTDSGEFCCEVCTSEKSRVLGESQDLEMLLTEDCEDYVIETGNEERTGENGVVHSNRKSEVELVKKVDDVEHNLSDLHLCSSNDGINISETSITNENYDAPIVKESSSAKYPAEMNPFGDDKIIKEAKPKVKPAAIFDTNLDKTSSNPFGSDFESDEDETNCQTAKTHTILSSTLISKPNESLNPFGSGFSSEDEGASSSYPQSPLDISTKVYNNLRPAPLPPRQPKSVSTSSLGAPAVTSSGLDNMDKNTKAFIGSHSTEMVKKLRGEDDLSSKFRTSNTNNTGVSSSIVAEAGSNNSNEGPMAQRRAGEKLTKKSIFEEELFDIEVKQANLEKQGVKLEKTIRDLCVANASVENAMDDTTNPWAEVLIMQLFDLRNEKNCLLRRQTELIYLKKENRLRKMQASCENQIRILMSKSESQKMDGDKLYEERLIEKLMDIVAKRNEVVDCLEIDRIKEIEEDTSIKDHTIDNCESRKPSKLPRKGLKRILVKKKKDKNVSNERISHLDKSEGKTSKKSLTRIASKSFNFL